MQMEIDREVNKFTPPMEVGGGFLTRDEYAKFARMAVTEGTLIGWAHAENMTRERMQRKISETDRLSLELQKALLAGNATLATSLSDQLEAAIKRNNELRQSLLATPEAPNPFRNWKVPPLDYGGNMLGTPLPPGFTPPKYPEPAPNPQGPTMPATNVPSDSYTQFGPQGGLGAGVIAGVNPYPPVNVTVTIDGQELTSIITETQVNDSLSGTFSGTNRFAARGAIAL